MLKKYLPALLFSFALVFLSVSHSYAYTLPANNCTGTSVVYPVTVISQNDLNGSIPLCVIASSNLPVGTYLNVVSGSPLHTTTTAGQDNFSYPKNFSTSSIGRSDNTFHFIASDNTGSQGTADITVNITAATILLTNDIGLTTTSNIVYNTATQPTFTCTNSTYMAYYPDASVASATNVGTQSGYTWSYLAPNSVGTHKIECGNIGGTATVQSFVWTVKALNMTGTISAPDCTIAVGASSCTTTVTWSTQNPVSTSAVTSDINNSFASSPNFSVATGNTGSKSSVSVPYSSRNFYLYNNSTLLAQATANASCVSGSSWDSTKGVCAITCTSPQVLNSAGTACYTPAITCTSPQVANSAGTACVCPSSAPAGADSSTCACGSTQITDTVHGICINQVTPNPYITDGGTNVEIDNVPYCPGGTRASLFIDSIDKEDQVGSDNQSSYTFVWASSQGTYIFACPNGSGYQLVTTIAALQRPYTHFLIFNVSASNVKVGSIVNLSWTIQDPTTTCSISADSISDGTNIWNTKSSTTPLGTNIDSSKITATTTKNVAIGNGSVTVNQSTRFTATCINQSAYLPGTYTLKRDVYVTGENETR